MFVIDASIIARDLDPTEPEHDICHELLEALATAEMEFAAPVLLLAEVAATISRTRRDAIRARVAVMGLRELANLILVPLDEILAQRAADVASDYRLRGADAVYVAVAEQLGMALVTLDEEQRTRATGIVTAIGPREALARLRATMAEGGA